MRRNSAGLTAVNGLEKEQPLTRNNNFNRDRATMSRTALAGTTSSMGRLMVLSAEKDSGELIMNKTIVKGSRFAKKRPSTYSGER